MGVGTGEENEVRKRDTASEIWGRVAARSAMDCPVTGDRTLAHGGCLRSSELRGSG